jgi:hypothetical protein
MGYEDEEVAEILEPGGRERPQRLIATNEPFSRRQRVALLLSALDKLVSELPTIQGETLKDLNRAQEEVEIVESISFVPEEDSTIGSPPLADLDDTNAIRIRSETARVLSALGEEVSR